MAQENLIKRREPDAAYASSKGSHLNVQAVEDAIAAVLSKIPAVKKVLCSNEGPVFEVTIIHSSSNDVAAFELIVERMVDIKKQVVSLGDAPDNLYIKRTILPESNPYTYGNWNAKTLFERK